MLRKFLFISFILIPSLSFGATITSDTFNGKHFIGVDGTYSSLITSSLTATSLNSTTVITSDMPEFYGAVGNGTHDDLPAFNAMKVALKTSATIYPTAGKFKFGKNKNYFLNGTFIIDCSMHLIGEGAGQQGGSDATIFSFPINTTGVIVTKGTNTPTAGGDSTIIEGIYFSSAGGTDTTKHGIDMQSRTEIKDSTFYNFPGNGINIVASSANNKNANNWRLDNVVTYYNGGHGLYVDGGDVNAGLATMVDASFNAGWGIYDSSFLGNTYVGCHTTDNVTGAYKADSATARNIFIGCYSESGQPASNIVSPSMVIGGLHGAGFVAGAEGDSYIDGYSYGNFRRLSNDGNGKFTLGGDTDTLLEITDMDENSGSFPFRLSLKTGSFFLDWANNNSSLLSLYDTNATTGNGYARTLTSGALGFENGFYFGSGMNHWTVASGMPTGSYEHKMGDIVWNNNPVNTHILCWIALTTGTENVLNTDWAAIKDIPTDSLTLTSTLTATTGAITTVNATTVNATTLNGNLHQTSGGSSGKVICWKTANTLGYCSSVVGSDGSCTCN